ncbi:hypothetical protein [Mycobacterium sp. AZCC_0083]|uniref:hypothetical protein n=1 Tax=Mycobacterium sp. AZCC_0083 TaxID=2735882 RepID=UPI00160B256F|nr:hypothetical protein [Mycobacterium sp. AZCC_0083]
MMVIEFNHHVLCPNQPHQNVFRIRRHEVCEVAVDHALQRGNAALEPVLHLRVVADNKGGRFDAVTHGAPPLGTPGSRPP